MVGELAGGGGCGVAAQQQPGGGERLLRLHNSQLSYSDLLLMQTCSCEFLHWTLLLVGSKVQSCSSGSSECPTSTTQYSTVQHQHRTDRLQVEEELQAAQRRQVVAVLLQSCLETRLNSTVQCTVHSASVQ